MRRQNVGYIVLAAGLLFAPACSRSEDPAGANRKDATATDRAGSVTNDTDRATERPVAPDPNRSERPTGTAGSATRDETSEAGPDAIITMKIQAKYAGDDVVKGRNIDVDTTNGVVTLKGSVDTRRERDAAEQLARETDGVKRVVNDLKVAMR